MGHDGCSGLCGRYPGPIRESLGGIVNVNQPIDAIQGGAYRVTVEAGAFSARLVEDRSGSGLQPIRDLCLQPLAFGADGGVLLGQEAEQALDANPDAGVWSYLSRIGDETPLFIAGRAVAAEDLLALALEHQLAGVAGEYGRDPQEICVVVPAEWGPHRQERVRLGLERRGAARVRLVPAPVATLMDPTLDLPSDLSNVLVLDAGDHRISAARLSREDEDVVSGQGWRLQSVAGYDFGGADIDDALLGFVLARLAETPSGAEALELRKACREAREELSVAPAIELVPPGGSAPLRLVRADLETLIGDHLRTVVAALLTRVGAGVDEGQQGEAVVLAGGLARMPLLVETVSQLVDRPVCVPAEPAAAGVVGAAHIHLVTKPAADAVEDPTLTLMAAVVAEDAPGADESDQSTRVQTDAFRRGPRRSADTGRTTGSLRRYSGIAAAAAAVALVISAPLAVPGLTGGVASLAGGNSAESGQVAQSQGLEGGSVENAAEAGSAEAAAEKPRGPLGALKDLFTPDPAGAPKSNDPAQDKPGPLRSLAARLVPESVKPSPAESSTAPADKPGDKGENPPATSEPTQPAPPAKTEEPAPPTTAPPTTAPPATEPPPATTAPPATEPPPATTAPPTTAPPSDPAPSNVATQSAPAPEPSGGSAAPSQDTVGVV